MAPSDAWNNFTNLTSYKWAWHTDWHPSVVCVLDKLSDDFPAYDPWNYNNHWRRVGPFENTQTHFVLDLFGPSQPWPRSQMPKDLGDQITAWFLARHRPRMLTLLWYKRLWTKTTGPTTYTGQQGQFVDHIHIEFDHILLPQWAVSNC